MKITADLRSKCSCYFGEVTSLGVLKVFFSDGTLANILYRTAQFFKKIKLGPIGGILLWLNKLLTGCIIGRGAEFGPGFVLMHPVGVVINSGVRGGENVVLESGVVIGSARNGLPVEVPVIGNNVFIGTGAKVLGSIKVGDNVKIGANAVVINDAPDGVTVVGIPARIVEESK